MKAQLDQISNYWRGLSARERLLVGIGGGVAVILLFYVLLLAPLQKDLNRLRVEVPRAQEQLTWMRTQANRIQQLRAATPAAVPGGSLLSFVEQSAQSYGVQQNMKRMEPQGANAVSVALDGVTFNNLLSWLSHLHKQGGVRVDNGSLEPQSAPGVVNARLVLRVANP
ncbi:MAG: type II secretion system protein M [Gammaproteobacteria bacterium]|nr:type II secretion system protein M [Gammaproteobacteria bacterium]